MLKKGISEDEVVISMRPICVSRAESSDYACYGCSCPTLVVDAEGFADAVQYYRKMRRYVRVLYWLGERERKHFFKCYGRLGREQTDWPRTYLSRDFTTDVKLRMAEMLWPGEDPFKIFGILR